MAQSLSIIECTSVSTRLYSIYIKILPGKNFSAARILGYSL